MAEQSYEVEYYIKPGDTLMDLSYQFYGTHQKWALITAANPHLTPKRLIPGERITVPTPLRFVESKPPSPSQPQKKRAPEVEDHQSRRVAGVESQKVEELDSREADVESAYADLKRENIELRSQVLDLQKAKSDADLLRKQVLELKSRSADIYSKELQTYTHLVEIQSRILKEKHRILSQRMWVLNNNRVDRCEIHVSSGQEAIQQKLVEMIEFANSVIGAESVYVHPESSQVVLHLPGSLVFGVDEPIVQPTYTDFLARLSRYFEALNVERIEIKGHSRFESVFNKDREERSGFFYALNQSLALRDFLVERAGISPKRVSVSSFGGSRFLASESQKKRFEMIISLESPGIKERRLASVKGELGGDSFVAETLAFIGEPKYSFGELTDHGIVLHIGRDYLWTQDSLELSLGGRQMLARLVQVLSQVQDVTFQFYWVSGLFEKEEASQRLIASSQLEYLKTFLEQELHVPSSSLEMGYESRQNVLRFPATEEDDRFNRRLIIRTVPNTISTRQFR